MSEQNGERQPAGYQALSAAISRFAFASRRMRRQRERGMKRKSLLRALVSGKPVPSVSVPDPVRVAVLAIDMVAAASMRASWTGAEVHIVAPDEATASILRAALAETARNRATDRLIRITVG